MFGYVVANLDKLSQEQRVLYRACYCGLCKALGERHGTACRATLTYDMSFLILLLSSLAQEHPEMALLSCAAHPLKKHPYFTSRFTLYAADMNVLLAYEQKMDDWLDDRRLRALTQARLIGRDAENLRESWPRQAGAISRALEELHRLEAEGCAVPDLPASAFGSLLGEIFVPDEEMPLAEELRAFGFALGRFIYLMDAALDLKEDLRRERYNPLVAVPSAEHEGILHMLMAQCTACYERLRITQNSEILENVLYSGIWTRYRARQKKEAAKS
ncbi:MAG: DUF5685 family protein [Christensenellales bacterium]